MLIGALTAFAGLLSLPFQASAETITLRNDTNGPVIVQAAIVINGQVRVDKPIVVKAGDATAINLPGTKLITIYNARNPSQIFNKSTVTASKEDGVYSIQADILPGRAKLEPVKPMPKEKPKDRRDMDRRPPDKDKKTPDKK